MTISRSENPMAARIRGTTVSGVKRTYFFGHLPGTPVQAVLS